MLIVTIDLHPATGGKVKRLGRMMIFNDGTGTLDRGNYGVEVYRRGSENMVQRHGTVKAFPRKSYNVWRLIARALLSAFPEES
jgi:polyisoprenoid-binding protein YceI